MPASIYCRVSSDEQESEGHSLLSQEGECRKYCAGIGVPVVEVFTDAKTGGTLDRPGLDKLRMAVRERRITHVVVLNLDRLSRSVHQQGQLFEEFNKHRVELHTVQTGHVDVASTAGKLLANMSGVIHEYVRDQMKDRARLARIRRVTAGKISISGAPPFGYDLSEDRSTLEVNPEEARDIAHIFRAYTGASSSLTAIARSLQGHPTPGDKGRYPPGFESKRPRKKVPGLWNESSIRLMILNPVYSGTWTYRRTQVTIDGERVQNEDTLSIQVPAIVSVAQQRRAIERLEENKRRRDGKRVHAYPLSGYLRCGVCGMSWSGYCTTYHGREYRYLRCAGRQLKSSLDGKTRRCSMPPLRADFCELLALDGLKYCLEEAEALALKHRVSVVDELMTGLNKHTPTRDFAGEIAKVEVKRVRLLAALDGSGAGKSAKDIGTRLKALDEEEERIKREQAGATDEQGQRYTLEQVTKGYQRLLAEVSESPELIPLLPAYFQATGTVIYVERDPLGLRFAFGEKMHAGVSARG